MVVISRQLILSMHGSDFDNNYICHLLVGASGGILIAGRSRLGAVQASQWITIVYRSSSVQPLNLLGGLLVYMAPKIIKKKYSSYRSSGTLGVSAQVPGWWQEIST